jgi:hypothetical protein
LEPTAKVNIMKQILKIKAKHGTCETLRKSITNILNGKTNYELAKKIKKNVAELGGFFI